MTRKLSVCVSAVGVSIMAFALMMVPSSPASAGGRYSGYGYATACCCCCVTYRSCGGYVRGRGYAGYGYAGYGYGRYGYAYPRYPYARGVARRQLRREAIRSW